MRTAYSLTSSIAQFLPFLPFMPELPQRTGKSRRRLQNILDEAFDNPSTRNKTYGQINSETLNAISELKCKTLILLPPTSTNLLESEFYETGIFPRKVFLDAFSLEYRLSDALLQLGGHAPKTFRDVIFIPASPIPLPMKYDKSRFVPAIDYANSVPLERKLFPGKSEIFYKFSEEAFDFENFQSFVGANLKIFDPRIAEHFSTDQFFEEQSYQIYLKNLLYAQLYDNLLERMQPSKVVLYSKKSSFIHKNVFSRFLKGKFIDLNIMRNTDRSYFGEVDPSALRILDGFLRNTKIRQYYIDTGEELELTNPLDLTVDKTDLEGMVFKSCPNKDLDFFLCEQATECREFPDRLKKDCARDYFQSFPHGQQVALRERATKHQFGFTSGVGLVARIMHGKNIPLFTSSGEMTTLKDQLGGSSIRLLKLPEFSKRKRHLRASSLVSKCDIGRLVGMKVRDRLDNIFTLSGTAMHNLVNTAPNDNYLHYDLYEKLGLQFAPYSDYCEKMVYYETPSRVVLAGMGDMVLGFDDGIIVIDFKTSLRQSKGYQHQLLVYGRAYAPYFDAKKIIGLNMLRQYDGDFGQDFFLNYDLVRYEGVRRPMRLVGFSCSPSLDDPFVESLHSEIDRTMEVMGKIESSKEYFEEYKACMGDYCINCIFNSACEWDRVK